MLQLLKVILLWGLFGLLSCHTGPATQQPDLPDNLMFLPDPYAFEGGFPNTILHRGVFSLDQTTYYFTLSQQDFTQFHVWQTARTDTGWSAPVKAFFNSAADDHGMSFSADGNTLVFSSTRPIGKEEEPGTWHLWQCSRKASGWSEPEYLHIPGLAGKLLSHPTLLPDRSLIFHSSEPDYSQMALYLAAWREEAYQPAQLLSWPGFDSVAMCTPYVSTDGQYLVFATVGEPLLLHVSKRQPDGQWGTPLALPDSLQRGSQGNPYLTPDGKYLLYARQTDSGPAWEIASVAKQSLPLPK
ncbi:MAG: hypothetical protein AAFQ98_19865 [Bacteroidota bacterium]